MEKIVSWYHLLLQWSVSDNDGPWQIAIWKKIRIGMKVTVTAVIILRGLLDEVLMDNGI